MYKMKALSLKQPFAELTISGKKKIELRKWDIKFRGEFLIHASKRPDKNSMKKFGFTDLPCGFIIGKATLINVKKYKNKEELLKDKYLHLAEGDWGNYGFILENPIRLNKMSAKGNLGFWEFKWK
ncbi:hypothetical protein ES703_105575 [subsurface metagenome]